MIMVKDSDFLDDNFFSDETSITRSPGNHDTDTLRERLNPEKLIRAFKLALMGAYEVYDTETDDDGNDREVRKVKRMKNFTPIINKQGIEEVTDYLQNLVNSHTLQSNFLDRGDYNNTCKFTFNRMCSIFISKRREWSLEKNGKVPLINIVFIYQKCRNIAKIVLRRALMDAERGHLSDSVKETIQTNKTPREKESLIQKAAGIFK